MSRDLERSHAEEEVSEAPQSRRRPAPGKVSLTSSLSAASSAAARPSGIVQMQRETGAGGGGFGGASSASMSSIGLHGGGDAPTSRMGRAFGQDFSDVKMVTDSPRATGSTEALTEGNEVHFGAGKYQPGTSGGDWLIAHELAHVTQQRGQSSTAQAFAGPSNKALERDANQAANDAVSGGSARVHLAATPGMTQRHDAFEHSQMGDMYEGTELAKGKTITTMAGAELSFGDVCAFGDFYNSPEDLMNAPREELEGLRKALHEERDHRENEDPEGKGGKTWDSDYEEATKYRGASGPTSVEGKDGAPKLTEPGKKGSTGGLSYGNLPSQKEVSKMGDGPMSESKYKEGANKGNSHHFGEGAKALYRTQHLKACKYAKLAYDREQEAKGAAKGGQAASKGASAGQGGKPAAEGGNKPENEFLETGGKPGTEGSGGSSDGGGAGGAGKKSDGSYTPAEDKKAEISDKYEGEKLESMIKVSEGFSAHFLTDCYASGHVLISTKLIRGQGIEKSKEGQPKTADEKNEELQQKFMQSAKVWLKPVTIMSGMMELMPSLDDVPDEVRDEVRAVVTPAVMGLVTGGVEAVWQTAVTANFRDLVLKTQHDILNDQIIEVTNSKGDTFSITGDSKSNAPEFVAKYKAKTMGIIAKAITASAGEVTKARKSGELPSKPKAEAFFPKMIVAKDGKKTDVNEYANDAKKMQQEFIAKAIVPGTGNPFWNMIKSFGPLAVEATINQLVAEEVIKRLKKGYNKVKKGVKKGIKKVKKGIDDGIDKAKELKDDVEEGIDEGIEKAKEIKDKLKDEAKKLKRKATGKGKAIAKALFSLL